MAAVNPTYVPLEGEDKNSVRSLEFKRTSIHKSAVIHWEEVEFGFDIKVYQFATIREGVTIGNNCAIGSKVYIGHQTKIGNNVRIQDGSHLTNNMVIEDDVFIGPMVVTMADRYPRALNPTYVSEPIIIRERASIGAGAIILPGVEIGHDAMIGAGTVIHKNVPPLVTMYGNPARIVM